LDGEGSLEEQLKSLDLVQDNKMGKGSVDQSPTVAFLFASGEYQSREIKSALGVLTDKFHVVVGGDASSVSGSNAEGLSKKSASVMVGEFPGCQLQPFFTEEASIPMECVSLFTNFVKGDEGQDSGTVPRVNFLFFSTPSFKADGMLRPISNLFSSSTKVGSVAERRVFLDDHLYEDGCVGLAISGNLAIDTVSVQPYKAMFVGSESIPVSVSGKTVDTSPVPIEEFADLFDGSLCVSFDEDGENAPVRTMSLVSSYCEETGTIEESMRVSGPQVNFEDEETHTMMRIFKTDRGIASMNTCKAVVKYSEESAVSLPGDIRGVMQFSSLGPDSATFFGIENHDTRTWNSIVGTSAAQVGMVGSGGISSCEVSTGRSTMFQSSTSFAAFREPVDADDTGIDLFISHKENFDDNELNTKPEKLQEVIESLDYSEDIFVRDDLNEAGCLPLFQVEKNFYVFPGLKKKVHVFEPRYRFLIKWCIKNNKNFGMFGGDDIGFLVRIEDYKEQADGRFFVTVEGIERFYLGHRWCRPATFGLEAGLFHTFKDTTGKEEKLHDDAVTMKQEVTSLLMDSWRTYKEGMKHKRSKVREMQDEDMDADFTDKDFENANLLFQQEEDYYDEMLKEVFEETPGDEKGPELLSFWAAQGLDLCHRLVGDDLGHFKLVEKYERWISTRSSERRIIEIQALAHYLRAKFIVSEETVDDARPDGVEVPKHNFKNFSRLTPPKI
jgi:hypothetical protein